MKLEQILTAGLLHPEMPLSAFSLSILSMTSESEILMIQILSTLSDAQNKWL
ncbi:MAG: hypothetical protein KAS84_02050 [Anaerolineales bacterium]|nr:hypothetical protein [Anaerolineales bacterium]